MFIKIALISLSLILSGCAGTGVKSFSSVMTLANSQNGSIFILRDTGYVGSGALISVAVNGQSIGEIGNSETAIGKTVSGVNYVDIRYSGIQGIGISPANASFQRLGNENKYFIITTRSSLISNSIQVLEVSANSFRASLQQM